MSIRFRKLGRQIKEASLKRQQRIQAQLVQKNQVLGDFMRDTHKLRSYLISGENKGEIDQLCQVIGDLEHESDKLSNINKQLVDDEFYVLEYEDIVAFGFDLIENE